MSGSYQTHDFTDSGQSPKLFKVGVPLAHFARQNLVSIGAGAKYSCFTFNLRPSLGLVGDTYEVCDGLILDYHVWCAAAVNFNVIIQWRASALWEYLSFNHLATQNGFGAGIRLAARDNAFVIENLDVAVQQFKVFATVRQY